MTAWLQRHAGIVVSLIVMTMSVASGACGSRQGDAAVAPQEIARGTACALDGMLLADYPGPKAQIFYAGASQPDFFCDLVEMFHVYLKPEQVRTVREIYVHDMGKADWDRPAGHWTDARTAFFVLDSKRPGSMGPTIASFALESDARAFVDRYGGRIVAFDRVTADSAVLDGGALHDGPM